MIETPDDSRSALEALVPADHPLRAALSALAAIGGQAGPDILGPAAERLGQGLEPLDHLALLFLATVYDRAGPADVLALLRFDLAARWFMGWPDGRPHDDPDLAAMRRAEGDPAMAFLLGRLLAAPEVARLLDDRHWKPRKARLKAAVRRARWGARRLRAARRRARSWRLLRRLVPGALALGLGLAGYALLALPSAAEIEALLGRPTIGVRMGEAPTQSGDIFMPVPVERDDLPEHFVLLLLTAEDRRFYYHPGFDPIGIARASLTYAGRRLGWSDAGLQGASTLTQQLAKNALLHGGKTWRRKFDELLLAIKLELMLEKDEILELYLANAHFGARIDGLELAARFYFGRRSSELRMHEAALLVSLLPAPARYRPDNHWPTARARAVRLLGLLAERHPEQAVAAARAGEILAGADSLADIKLGTREFRRIEHRYFRDWALAGLKRDFPAVEGEHRLVLTLDPLAQLYAQITVERLAREGRDAGFDGVAVVVMRPDGTVLAIVGGGDYGKSQFSLATDAHRQPGSAFKPFVYLAAVEAGYSAGDRIDDRPFGADGWPRNYRGAHQGTVTLEHALRHSLNGAAVQLAETIGREKVIEAARRLGIKGSLPDRPSLTLGVGEVTLLELVSAYAVFANGGFGVEPKGVLGLRREDGQVVAWTPPARPERLIELEHARAMNRLLRSVVAPGGSGNPANLSGDVAGKTGTTQHHRDAWFIGFTGDLVIGIWLGNADNRPMSPAVSGGTLPARHWSNLMANLRDNLLGGATSPPPGLGGD